MTSNQIRQSFLDFFKSKQHTIVPSSSLMPDSPNLLFTNAGMNQFVPIFLGQRTPDVDKWPGAIAGLPTRAADTQKCIRAGGKHNDLEDVGLDTYHHTFFEMLGNWSFGDYFKKEAIEWAWELVVQIWKFPPQRLYATVYNPDKAKNDPAEFDQEAWNVWTEKFRAAGLDPSVHIVSGNKKDNFWMMGDTGPCGPCSELHVDLTPQGDTVGSLVNKGDARCIEIWNLVFIQFNANPDGSFSPLPAKHVDTGMGFERVAGIIQNTKGFTDFTRIISNYETDIFRPIFDELEEMSGKKYGSTLPRCVVGQASRLPGDATVPVAVNAATGTVAVTVASGDACATAATEQEKIDVAFRVIADHIRTLSFAIADGIQPGNTDRNYVLRRILRRAVRYGRTLGFHEPFFYKLVDVLADTMGDVFPEVRLKKEFIKEVIRKEEEAFNKTLDRGLAIFYEAFNKTLEQGVAKFEQEVSLDIQHRAAELEQQGILTAKGQPGFDPAYLTRPIVSGELAFQLYDTYGFPLDLTELLARERGLTVNKDGFEKLMKEQRARARAAQKKEVITVSSEGQILSNVEAHPKTQFVGYDQLSAPATVLTVIEVEGKKAVVVDKTPLYGEMGGQVSDKGQMSAADTVWTIVYTKPGHVFLHFLDGKHVPSTGTQVELTVDKQRRRAIERHHTVTHLLHWALHEVVNKDASQKGSFVGPDKLTFDFNAQPLTPQQVADIEKLVNERILENACVSWMEAPYGEVKTRNDVMQFFGDKYGDTVRVVQIGGRAGELNGYSMELCGGTHTRATGEIGLFRILGEGAIAAGVRRIEAVAGLEAYRKATDELSLIKSLAGKVNTPVGELEKKIESLLAHQKELEKQVKTAMQRNASNAASELLGRAQTVNGIPLITCNLGDADGDFLQAIADALKGRFKGVVVLGGYSNNAVTLIATVSPDFTARVQAGKIIQQIAPIVGGKGGGKPDNARGGGKDASKLDEALAKVKSLLG